LAKSQIPASGTKRKALHDQILDIANEDRIQRVKIVEIKEKEKSRRSRTKITVKHQLEVARMRHAAEEAAKQRAHEAQMMERQMNFQIHLGRPAPALAPAPVNGAPGHHPAAAGFMFDPALLNQGL
jgi:hypothetical protein